jgi:2-(1,2-epoxy-1,2-dihydrophenyl)acetyl-CoA isomerase
MADAETLTAHLATQPTCALGLTKALLNHSSTSTLDRQLDLERDAQRRAGQTHDYAEGVKAFAEKRPPVFTGRE